MKVETDSVTGPASYATGGFIIATGLATVDHLKLFVVTPGANLPHCHFEYSLSGGNVTVKVMRNRSDETTSIDAVTGLPGGVSLRTTSGGQYVADTTHTHSIDHDHGAFNAPNPTPAGGGVQTAVGGINQTTHVHNFDTPNLTGTSGAGTSHTHTWDSLYQHQHLLTQTATQISESELPNTTDLSGTTFFYRAIGS